MKVTITHIFSSIEDRTDRTDRTGAE